MNYHATSVLLAVPLVLVACGGQPARLPAEIPPPLATAPPLAVPGTPGVPARRPSVTQKRGGAYYKDDGPGDAIPDWLDTLADAQPRVEALHRFANRPYLVLGKVYVPETTLRPFQQRGVASWYGKKFHGQKTSIGEPYDMFAMTAAHPTLAIPSYVRVTRVANGNSVVVRVTDRGPFHADRIIDLSYAAAHRLGYVDNGSTLVEVEAIAHGEVLAVSAPAPPPIDARDEIEALALRLALAETAPGPSKPATTPSRSPASGSGTFLQLGAFSSSENAESLRSHLSRELDWLAEAIQITPGGGLFRVQLGPYAKRGEAEKVAERIRAALGYTPALINR